VPLDLARINKKGASGALLLVHGAVSDCRPVGRDRHPDVHHHADRPAVDRPAAVRHLGAVRQGDRRVGGRRPQDAARAACRHMD